jgi:tetratricopeptide (TPR) repeat protein
MNFEWLNVRAVYEFGATLAERLVSRQKSARPLQKQIGSASNRIARREREHRASAEEAHYLLARGNRHFAEGQYSQAVAFYRELARLNSRQGDALNNLGAALFQLGCYEEAEEYFRQAIADRPDHPEAHSNLGAVRREKGDFRGAELSLRRALKLKPRFVNARCLLGLTLAYQGRVIDARAHFEKVLRVAPRNTDALLGMGQLATIEGRFEEARELFERTLEIDPYLPGTWAALVRIRRMTSADHAWLKSAERIAASGIPPAEEADLSFAIGKFCDDVGDFKRAFRSYQRGNELLKAAAAPYGRRAREQFVEDLIRVYTREAVSRVGAGASASTRPILLVGMPRSGTSLVEQIIASHPSATGAGEVGFWNNALREHAADIAQGLLDVPVRKRLAAAYERALGSVSTDALRVVDKTPVNSDYIGIIHSVFPTARFIYMRRNPIDTCLSCYFQPLSRAHVFTMDLSDLAHYYRHHQRLMAHWREVLPAGTILDVPYSELVTDHERWSRRILEFAGLDWHERCLDFHALKRPVMTASNWQVRQKIYHHSLERWRNYAAFIGPLMELRDSA